MKANPYLVRNFEIEADYEMFAGWHIDRGVKAPPQSVLQTLGVIAHLDGWDAAAMFLYMSNSCGVCFAEHLCTRPGLGLRAARLACERCLDYLKLAASEMDYGLMVIHTRPGIERFASKLGFQTGFRDVVTMYCATKEDHNGN